MNGSLLAGIAVVMAVLLLVLPVVAAFSARLAMLGSLLACVAGLVLGLVFVAGGAGGVHVSLPVGLPGQSMALALDGVSGFFLILVMLLGAAASAAALEDHGPALPTAPAFPVFLGGMVLALLAGDGVSLVAGFELMSLASFALVVTSHRDVAVRSAGLLYLGIAGLGALCLIGAVGVLGGAGVGFDAIRTHPPQGWRASALLVLVLVGAGSKAGLAPLHVWLPPAHAAAPGPVSALMSGAMTKVALYVLIRLLFDLAGTGQPGWWALPLLAMGAAGAVIGALRANLEADVKSILACSTIENVGLITVGLGVAFAARAADLPSLAGLAMGAALLHAMGHATFKGLLFLAAGAIQYQAGSRLLSRLGGLIHTMPFTAAGMLIGAACLAGLPPTAGFAGEWLLFQSVLGAIRLGGLGSQIVIAVLAATMALATALAAAAAVRLVGVALLGRPRTPQAAGAHEVGPPMRWAMIGLAAAAVLVGMVPSVVLGLAEPALRTLTGGGMEQRAGVLSVSPQLDGPGYWPLAITALISLSMLATAAVLRLRAVQGHRTGPAWDCGFGAPPPWLANGNPLTQYSGGSFAQPLRRALGVTLLDARELVTFRAPGDMRNAHLTVTVTDPADAWLFTPVAVLRARISRLADRVQFLTVRQSLSVIFVALVAFLALIALLEQA